MKKGLRQNLFRKKPFELRPALRPDEEGIKTKHKWVSHLRFSPALRPDEEGIKTSGGAYIHPARAVRP